MGMETTFDSLWRAVDRPAHEALRLADRPLSATLAPAALGMALVAAASTAAHALLRLHELPMFGFDVLKGVFEALLIVLPGTMVFAIYLRIRLRTRVLLASASIGLLAAGLVAACVLPLMVFLSLVSETSFVLALPSLLVPSLALATAAAIPGRIITTLDVSRTARRLVLAYETFLVLAFVVRGAAPFFQLLSRW